MQAPFWLSTTATCQDKYETVTSPKELSQNEPTFCPFVSHGSSSVSKLESAPTPPALHHHSHSLGRHRCGRPADFLRPKRDGNLRQNHRGDGRWRQCTDGTAILLKRVSHHCRLQQQVRPHISSHYWLGGHLRTLIFSTNDFQFLPPRSPPSAFLVFYSMPNFF